jgi:hypothetical protein
MTTWQGSGWKETGEQSLYVVCKSLYWRYGIVVCELPGMNPSWPGLESWQAIDQEVEVAGG